MRWLYSSSKLWSVCGQHSLYLQRPRGSRKKHFRPSPWLSLSRALLISSLGTRTSIKATECAHPSRWSSFSLTWFCRHLRRCCIGTYSCWSAFQVHLRSSTGRVQPYLLKRELRESFAEDTQKLVAQRSPRQTLKQKVTFGVNQFVACTSSASSWRTESAGSPCWWNWGASAELSTSHAFLCEEQGVQKLAWQVAFGKTHVRGLTGTLRASIGWPAF